MRKKKFVIRCIKYVILVWWFLLKILCSELVESEDVIKQDLAK